MEDVLIRPAGLPDAPRLLAIYGHYVLATAVTFEYEVPAEAEFERRMSQIMQKYPYLVAEAGSHPVGFAYAAPFHPRAAYAWCCEVTIYLDPAWRGRGIGRKLYESLESTLRRMGLLNLYACIAVPETADEYLTGQSEAFHAHLGYRQVGFFRSSGYKFHRWYHMIWMEKTLGEHLAEQPAVIPCPELSP